ncbi:MAG: flavodoxin-dependent (E)-4-hydroxy-3-methylbut-2-enyl-diphosphate synthase [Candidatus Hatepunaea meridiana]|nr:flavodoxin-dependent (E)-4-hydroxy-3-methylbut-2-enyl-diphosphate synthase [Candidatus Hatepunaea meridiana]
MIKQILHKSNRDYKRFTTNPNIRAVKVGHLTIGGGTPVVVQSMCSSDTRDVKATLAQIHRLVDAGCELVRVAVPDERASEALPDIIKEAGCPIVADIHFHYKLALEAISAGVAKVRINPGNIGSPDRVKVVVDAAGAANIPIRIGVNSGSMPQDILERDNFKVTAEGMVDAAFREVELLESEGFNNIIVAMKASDVSVMIEANRLFRCKSNIPLHLGVTEAGLSGYGSIKSAIGIGTLLLEGIGETIRVSLTAKPEEEIQAAWWILEATGVRRRSPELISCPTCGRAEIDLIELTKEVEKMLKGIEIPFKVAVMGCIVNGPGEAREADIGLVGGKGKGLVIRRGEIIHSVTEDELLPMFKRELDKLCQEYKADK